MIDTGPATLAKDGVVVWFTGRPSSGKSKLAKQVFAALRSRGRCACMLDGDSVRSALAPAPGYDARARADFYATLSNLAAMLARQGLIVLVPATAHLREFRDHARNVAPAFIEVHVDASEADAKKRDTKGLYAAVEAGRLRDVPGADLAYQPPLAAEVRASGGLDPAALEQIMKLLDQV